MRWCHTSVWPRGTFWRHRQCGRVLFLRKTRWKTFPPMKCVAGMHRELDLMKSFPECQSVPRADVNGKVWSTRWCHRRKEPKQERAWFVVRQFATSLDAAFYSPALGLEFTRVLLVMALLKKPTILFCDIGVASMNTPTRGSLRKRRHGVVPKKGTERFEGCITKASPTFSHLDLVLHVPTHSQHSSCTLRATCSLQHTSMIWPWSVRAHS